MCFLFKVQLGLASSISCYVSLRESESRGSGWRQTSLRHAVGSTPVACSYTVLLEMKGCIKSNHHKIIIYSAIELDFLSRSRRTGAHVRQLSGHRFNLLRCDFLCASIRARTTFLSPSVLLVLVYGPHIHLPFLVGARGVILS